MARKRKWRVTVEAQSSHLWKEWHEAHLDQKEGKLLKKIEMVQDENKKIKQIGEDLRGDGNSLNTKNQEVAEARHQIHKMENWWNQAMKVKKEMEDKFEAQVKSLQAELKENQDYLRSEQCKKEESFIEICELKDQYHQHRVSYDQLREESSYWEGWCCHL